MELVVKMGAALNVFVPAIVCVVVLTMPGLVPSPTPRVRVDPEIDAPFVIELLENVPTVLTPAREESAFLPMVTTPAVVVEVKMESAPD